MAHNVVDSALNKFIAATDRVSHFAARLNNASTDSASLYTCQVRRDQMRALWDKVEKEYEACSCVMSDEMTTDELPTIQAKYDYCYILYEQWSAQLSEQIADASQALTPRTPVQPQAVPFVSTGCRPPPLSEVEKLFHLNSKTSGEAHAIVSKSPLTNEGFQSAWSSLTERFENKRLLVNSQLRILFNLPAIGQESGAAIQELQSTIQGCLTALEHSKINTENWDCILVFLCSSRLPKLTLSLWEQSIQNKSDVPTWADMNAFLLERYRTLEAIAEVSASTSAPTVPRASRKEAPRRQAARALIDSGSEATFLSEKLFKRLRMPYTSVQARVSGLTQAVAAQPRKFCQFLIGSPVRPDLQIEASAIQLADPKFHESSQIDVLLGADILPSILLGGSHPNICGTLLGQETIFGWILTGPVSGSISKSISSFSARLSVEEELLSKFWEVEDLPASPAKESDLFCEANFNATTVRTSTGRYMVTLPFRDPGHVDLGHSRAIALAQFLRNESRLKRNDSLKEQYDSVIREYLDLGHITQVPPSSSGNYYLPHHGVLKPDSTTTKLRVVFNASSPTSNGKSLNDILHTGPILQSDLTIQILKWRFFKFVFNADITKMYRQILVDPKHTRFQRLLFRTPDEKLCDFELNTVTFGVNCAPYLAIRVLHQLASDVRDRYPLASDIIANYMYVDDVQAGAHTKQDAVSAIDKLRTALESAGFPLRKWTSNSKDVLRRIPKDHLLCADFLEIDEASVAKTLGIRWRSTSDEFFFVTAEMVSKPSFSKREVLSQIAKLFDPAEQWTSFLRNYSSLQYIRIPRWTNYAPGAKIQFHGFCDASQSAYGAALYAPVETAGQVSVSLLAAKTRVAPIKTVSLPRLELCGALLLAELSAALLPHFPTPDAETYLWTDSTIVLAWLDKQPCKWTTFVANRVAKIHSVNGTWQHVRSEHNPADLASRGVSPQELLASRLWWQGPEWLTHSPAQWPSPVIGLDTELECRAVKVHAAQVLCEDFLDRFSRFDRALRVFAYVRRFAQRCRQPKVSFPETLSSQELAEAQERLIVQAQNRVYAKDKVSCVPGRVRASTSLSYDERHPIILPFGCVFSRLLVSFTHQVSLHGGNQLVMRLVRTKFWIPKLRNLVKTVISACKTCVIHRRKIQSQLMGYLPTARSTFSRPFTNSGVDFAGPFDVKSYVGRGCKITKGYVCVFVGLSTKAIHLEATTDLTAEKFLEAFSRFVARRGCPLHMYSDNGKTFVGASSILSKEFVESTRNLIVTTHSHQGVKSFKTHFYKTVSSVKHTFEELSTLLSKIEACLNSRPLTPMSEDVSDLEALTPGHFLIGGPLLSMAEPESREDVESIRNRWQRLKALHQHFCVRWKSEYLKELHKRNKWQSPSRDLQIGDMVVIREENRSWSSFLRDARSESPILFSTAIHYPVVFSSGLGNSSRAMSFI
ncbi:uncharacterized protein LOC133836632 [Drosophila sulfurigaster albostrigata]|uniref:uncharacterized protein LOC133836632 n=1 Tax=Drosophila sulfurigaster albostrigata TaxID=89887 RepID=UPI002D21D3BE|nr:uncharacterized protein LOC133836632 [Drosophila sulfurigaster albostrigata]